MRAHVFKWETLNMTSQLHPGAKEAPWFECSTSCASWTLMFIRSTFTNKPSFPAISFQLATNFLENTAKWAKPFLEADTIETSVQSSPIWTQLSSSRRLLRPKSWLKAELYTEEEMWEEWNKIKPEQCDFSHLLVPLTSCRHRQGKVIPKKQLLNFSQIIHSCNHQSFYLHIPILLWLMLSN